MKYKDIAKKANKEVERLFDIINKNGRHNTELDKSVIDGYWSDLWFIACELRRGLERLESAEKKLKDQVVEKVAHKILKTRGIDLNEIIEKYTTEDY